MIFGSRFVEFDDEVCPGRTCHGRQLDLERIQRVGRRLLEGVVERVLVELTKTTERGSVEISSRTCL